jgi:hypothetical protein
LLPHVLDRIPHWRSLTFRYNDRRRATNDKWLAPAKAFLGLTDGNFPSQPRMLNGQLIVLLSGVLALSTLSPFRFLPLTAFRYHARRDGLVRLAQEAGRMLLQQTSNQNMIGFRRDRCETAYVSMSRSRIRIALIALFIVAAESYVQRAHGATILSGSVAFNSNTGLYTYSYALDNTNGTKGVSEITVLVVRQNSVGHFPSPPWPVPHTSPSGWNFDISNGGLGNGVGGNYTWRGYLPVGSVLSGFAFSVNLAPAKSSLSNYFLFGWNTISSGPAINGGIIEIGNIVVPDVPNTASAIPPSPTRAPKAVPLSPPVSLRGSAFPTEPKRGPAY